MTSRRPSSVKSCLASRPSARAGQPSSGVKTGRVSSNGREGRATLRVGSASALKRRIASYRHGTPRRALCEASWCSISWRQRRACHACKSRERALLSLHPAARTPKRKLGSDEGGGSGKDSSAAVRSPYMAVAFGVDRFVRFALGTLEAPHTVARPRGWPSEVQASKQSTTERPGAAAATCARERRSCLLGQHRRSQCVPQ